MFHPRVNGLSEGFLLVLHYAFNSQATEYSASCENTSSDTFSRWNFFGQQGVKMNIINCRIVQSMSNEWKAVYMWGDRVAKSTNILPQKFKSKKSCYFVI